MTATCHGRVTMYSDRVGDVLRLEQLDSAEALGDLLLDLRAVVGPQLGIDRARLDQRHPHVAPRDLLAQRLAERPDAVLGQVVDAAAVAAPGRPPS